MTKIHLLAVLLITGYILPQIDCEEYQKAGFLQTTTKITAVTSCKLFANTLYTTADGILHHWVFILLNNEYQLGASSAHHQLECGRYAWKMVNSYVGVLDDHGDVTVWKEIFEQNVPVKSKLIKGNFQTNRLTLARDISVDSDYIAVGYHNITANTTKSAIDIYNLNSGQNQPITILYDAPYRKFKLDLRGNLAVVAEQGGNLFFRYYTLKGEILEKPIVKFYYGANFALDYEQGGQYSGIVFSFLISTATEVGFINYTTSNKLTEYQSKYSPGLFPPRLCDGELSSISLSLNTTVQKMNNPIIPLAQPITSFTCTTNTTQGQLWSMYYIASVDDKNNYYIDVYWIAKNYHFWAIFGGVLGGICCCACIVACIRVYIVRKREGQDNYIRAQSSKESIQTL